MGNGSTRSPLSATDLRIPIKPPPLNINFLLENLLCGFDHATYRADWEPAATSGRHALGVFWRCPAVLWGTIYTRSNSGFMGTEKLANFSCVIWICGGLAPCGPSALLATKKASFRIKTCRLAIPLIMEQKLRNL